MNQDIKTIIEETANAAAHATASEFKKQNLLKNNRQTPFQKTEQILYNYCKFKDAIQLKNQQIEDLKKQGIPQTSKSIVLFSSSSKNTAYDSFDKLDEKIKQIQESIQTTQRLLNLVDNALIKIKQDPYYKVINHKYFEGKTHEEIAAILDKDVSTITRNKTRLVNELKIKLFSDEVIGELFS